MQHVTTGLPCTFYWCWQPGCSLHPDSYGQVTADGQLPPCPCQCHRGPDDGVPAAKPCFNLAHLTPDQLAVYNADPDGWVLGPGPYQCAVC